MYRAKEQAGSCWVESAPDMRADAGTRLSALADLRAALGTGQLALHYQPIVDLRSAEVVAAEALGRWERPGDGRLVAPAEFIGLAEQSGLIVALGREVLERACRQSRAGLLELRRLEVRVAIDDFGTVTRRSPTCATCRRRGAA